MDREEMLRREEDAWRRFAETVRAVPADRRDVEGVVPGWTVHDLVWHVGYWAGYAADVIERDRAGDATQSRRIRSSRRRRSSRRAAA